MKKNGEYYIISSWLDTAVRKIRYSPDRKRVRRELASHLEDAMDAYMEGGCDMLIMETGHHKVEDVLAFAVENKIPNLRFTHHGRQILDNRLEMEKLCNETSAKHPICVHIMRDKDVELF